MLTACVPLFSSGIWWRSRICQSSNAAVVKGRQRQTRLSNTLVQYTCLVYRIVDCSHDVETSKNIHENINNCGNDGRNVSDRKCFHCVLICISSRLLSSLTLIFQYERRKELPVKVRKERKPRQPKAKKRKLSTAAKSTPAKKQRKKAKRKKYVVNSDSEFSEQDDLSDEDYTGSWRRFLLPNMVRGGTALPRLPYMVIGQRWSSSVTKYCKHGIFGKSGL